MCEKFIKMRENNATTVYACWYTDQNVWKLKLLRPKFNNACFVG